MLAPSLTPLVRRVLTGRRGRLLVTAAGLATLAALARPPRPAEAPPTAEGPVPQDPSATAKPATSDRHRLEALVIERTARLRHRAEQLRTINLVGQRLVQIRNLDELLPFICNELRRAFSYENVNIFLIGDDPKVLEARASSGTYGRIAPGDTLRVGEQGIVGWVAGSGQPLLANDVSREPRYLVHDWLAETRAELAVPIRLGDQVLGVLDIESRHVDAFDETDLSTAQTLADLIAVAIENARLYDQTRALAVTEERNRLAREIHDTIAQGLTALTLQLELADAALPADLPAARQAIARALSLARTNLEEARRSVQNLRSRSLNRRSLADAIRALLEQAGKQNGYYYAFRHNLHVELAPAVENGVYRIVQEALTNINRHAQASEVNVALEVHDGTLRLVIEDDGVGFDPEEVLAGKDGHFGLIGMQERAHLLGGTLAISSTPGEGTAIELRIPLQSGQR
ncbi:MAG: GAF domain-containing sensor histidine kinase [Chloroflexi bacterium]|nr:GAF domain-containing sensor histidine kinase [Chloroflexota bacterium]